MNEFLNKHIFPYTEKYIGWAKKTKDGFPIYTQREDMFNSISHIIGIFIGVGMIIASISNHHSSLGLFGGIIFGISLIILYSASSIYHGTPLKCVKERKIFRLLDHCSIFILIAGTCTPFILSLIYHRSVETEWIFYALIWLVAMGGITLLCVNMKKYKSVTTTMYLAMCIALVARSDEFLRIIGDTGIELLLVGGAVYLVGFLFYGLGSRKEWMHAVFHVLCLIGSVMHCVCIYNYVI